MKLLHQNILLPACSNATIARAKDVFTGWIDSDFVNYGTDVKSPKTKATKIAVLEMTKDGTFKDIFTNPEEMCMTQAQIVEFCRNHKDKLNQDWYTFFLFKVGNEFFVARVRVRSDGLSGDADRFSDDGVWDAVCRHRVVVPQLALKNSSASDTLAPGHSDSLTLEQKIDDVKKGGYTVVKII